MLLVVGNEHCSRCKMTLTILENKKIEYAYKLITDFSQEEQDNFLKLAKKVNQTSFPLIIKNEKLITLQEV